MLVLNRFVESGIFDPSASHEVQVSMLDGRASQSQARLKNFDGCLVEAFALLSGFSTEGVVQGLRNLTQGILDSGCFAHACIFVLGCRRVNCFAQSGGPKMMAGRGALQSAPSARGVFGLAGEEPEAVGEAVEEDGDVLVFDFAGVDEGLDAAFGAAGDGAGHVKSGGVEGFAGRGPAFKGDVLGFDVFDPVLEGGVDFGGCDLETILDVAGVVAGGGGEFAHDGDEAALDDGEALADFVPIGGGAGEAEGGVEFIDGAAGFDAGMGFADAPVVHEAGGSGITGFCGDAHGGQK